MLSSFFFTFVLAQPQFSFTDDFVDFIPDVSASLKVRESIRHALQKMILYPSLNASLVQFWGATKTLEGWTLLTTQNQPFALGATYSTIQIQWLCKYRMICREYNFYADAESEEEKLGLPGRVFLHKFPESTPSVKYYSLKEYPQRDLALHCTIRGSWALPVFERSSQTCVGVLELVSLYDMPSDWHDKSFLGHLYRIFEEFGLQCFDGFKHYEMRYKDENQAIAAAFKELKMVSRYVCKIHKLSLALTWVSCSACDYLVRGQNLSKGGDLFGDKFDVFKFKKVLKSCHLRKGEVTGRILPFPNLLYCSDVKQFSIAEYPLVPYARHYKLSGWFTMCLQSNYTRNEVYVLELFLPASSKDDENILTTISLILGTMKEKFKTFKLVSGQELGDILSVEVFDFQNDQNSHSVQIIQATRIFPSLEVSKDRGVMSQLGQLNQPAMDAIDNGMNVVSGAQKYSLPSLEPLQIQEVTTQLDSCDQLQMDLLDNGKNVVTVERTIEGTRKTQEREHKKTGVRIQVSLEDILKCSKMRLNDAAVELRVSISTLRRVCRDYGISRWPPRNIKKVPFQPSLVENQGQTPQLGVDLPSNHALASVSHSSKEIMGTAVGEKFTRKSAFQDAEMVTIRAKFENNTIKFRLSLSSRLVELQEEVTKRLNLEPRDYYIKYKDEEDELILITCDDDLQDCIHSSRFLGNTSIGVLLELKQPVTNLNPAH
ncbi:hypothetical protein RHMOL_Rhmol05G0121700 [Rhododendron molle]|uniref:Uncharacterized protein n=1 Tax=Rhododendron molle TaxID=49168 RepID=A0ACC0NPD0_RHOML|nr:hypothetical protein RHMOL_Rhmol05G0121700 [Rhododendron molle]